MNTIKSAGRICLLHAHNWRYNLLNIRLESYRCIAAKEWRAAGGFFHRQNCRPLGVMEVNFEWVTTFSAETAAPTAWFNTFENGISFGVCNVELPRERRATFIWNKQTRQKNLAREQNSRYHYCYKLSNKSKKHTQRNLLSSSIGTR